MSAILNNKKIMLIGLKGGSGDGSDIVVDSEFSDTSTNPIQNKVVKAELDKKANKNITHIKWSETLTPTSEGINVIHFTLDEVIPNDAYIKCTITKLNLINSNSVENSFVHKGFGTVSLTDGSSVTIRRYDLETGEYDNESSKGIEIGTDEKFIITDLTFAYTTEVTEDLQAVIDDVDESLLQVERNTASVSNIEQDLKTVEEALDGKLDKPSTPERNGALVFNPNGSNELRPLTIAPVNGWIPTYGGDGNGTSDGNGKLWTGTPKNDYHCATKKYVDDNLLLKADNEITHNGWKKFSSENYGADEFFVRTGVTYNPNATIKGEITTISELGPDGVYKTYLYYCKASSTLTFDDGFTVAFSQSVDYEDEIKAYTNSNVVSYSLSILTELTEDLHKVVKDIEKDTIANEGKIGDIETALDSIIKIQNSLIGGVE